MKDTYRIFKYGFGHTATHTVKDCIDFLNEVGPIRSIQRFSSMGMWIVVVSTKDNLSEQKAIQLSMNFNDYSEPPKPIMNHP